jgi:hypothetical protein
MRELSCARTDNRHPVVGFGWISRRRTRDAAEGGSVDSDT